MVNLDTHIVIHTLLDTLRPDERRTIVENAWAMSDAVLWELGWLEREERIAPVLRGRALSQMLGRTTVYPIDKHVAYALRQLDFRSDPADEVIAATSIVHDIPLLTRDARLLASRVVPLALR